MAVEFFPGKGVSWHGDAATVIEVRGERVALTRLRDEQTILTTVIVLACEQPPIVAPRSLLGPVA